MFQLVDKCFSLSLFIDEVDDAPVFETMFMLVSASLALAGLITFDALLADLQLALILRIFQQVDKLCAQNVLTLLTFIALPGHININVEV